MNKTELVAKLAAKTGLTKKDTLATVDAFMEEVKDALSNGDEVALIGFGTFKTAKRAARNGRNPSTGKAIKIPAATVPKFVAGKALKEAV